MTESERHHVTWTSEREQSPSHPLPEVAARLTHRLVWLFLAGATDEVARYIAPDTALILPGETISPVLTDDSASLLSELRARLPQNQVIVSEQYDQVPISPISCAVSVRCSVRGYAHGEPFQTDSPQTSIVCSLVWCVSDHGNLKLRLCHCSTQQDDAEQQSHADAFKQLDAKHLAKETTLLQVRDSDGVTHWLAPENIIYVAAAHQYTDIYCRDRRLRMHMPFGTTVQQLRDAVIPVHRSYAINPQYISHLRDNRIYLTTGTNVPVPAKRLSGVRTVLERRFGTTIQQA